MNIKPLTFQTISPLTFIDTRNFDNLINLNGNAPECVYSMLFVDIKRELLVLNIILEDAYLLFTI